MNLPFELSIGLRYMRAKRKQTFVSVITAFGVLGVTLGVMTMIIVLAVMNGFERDLTEKIMGTVAHLDVVSHSSPLVEGWPRIMRKIETVDGVEAVTPYIYGQAMLSSHGRVRGVIIRGIDPATSGNVISLSKYLVKGSVNDLSSTAHGMSGLILGEDLAMMGSVEPGDIVQLISPQGKRTPIGAIPKSQNFRVVGTFKSGMYEYDANLAYMALPEAQQFFQMGQGVTGVEVAVKDIFRAPALGDRIRELLGSPFWTRTWKDKYRNLFSALKLEKAAMFVILTFIVLVAAFNIIISLIMLVMEKARDIAILKALGATSDRIMRIFIIQGMTVGIIGTFLGAMGGLGGAALLKRYKIVELPADIYTITRLPVAVNYPDVAIICVVALSICFLATIYPSLRAARFQPVEALRYE